MSNQVKQLELDFGMLTVAQQERVDLFIKNQIHQFDNHLEVPLHFIGSIGFYLQEELKKSLKSKGLKCGKILKKPIDGLVAYHQSLSN